VKSMAKAKYSTKNIGHYGLAFKHYTHFTSPIRRYPDVMVHRLLDAVLNKRNPEELQILEKKCRHSSEMEQRAEKAERSSIKYKQVEFLKDSIGEIFDGVISDLTDWGIYVELKANKCEGMVPLRDMDDDYYVFDEENYAIYGKHTRRRYSIGDDVTIRIVRADLQKKQLDFKLLN